VTSYYYARLIVRIHAITMVTGQSLKVEGYGTDPSSEDPREFVLATSTLSVAIASTDSAGSLLSDTDTDIYPFMKMVVTGTQGASTGSQSLYAVLSADLLLREA